MRISAILFSVLFLLSCGSSIEGEQKSWYNKKQMITEYATKYPYLKDKINAQYNEAEAAMKKAEGVKNEEERIKAMQRANSLATQGAIDNLKKAERSLDDLKDEIRDIKDDFTSEEFSQKTTYLLEEAKTEMEKLKNLLSNGNAGSPDQALLAIKTETENVKEIIRSLDNHYDQVIDSRPKETSTTDSVTTDNKVESKSDQHDHKLADVKCPKCGSLLPGDATKCKNCGAAIKKQ